MMAKYISKYRVVVHLTWEDDEDPSFQEYTVEEDVDFGCAKEIDWFLEAVEQQRNKEEEIA